MQTLVIAKALIVNDAGEILLLRRSKTDVRRPLQWDFPGGFVDEGEDILAAVLRETKEEAGLDLKQAKLIYAMTEVAEKGGSGTWVAFLGRVKGQPAITISNEHDRYTWMPLRDALTVITYERQQKMVNYLAEHGLLAEDNAA